MWVQYWFAGLSQVPPQPRDLSNRDVLSVSPGGWMLEVFPRAWRVHLFQVSSLRLWVISSQDFHIAPLCILVF